MSHGCFGWTVDSHHMTHINLPNAIALAIKVTVIVRRGSVSLKDCLYFEPPSAANVNYYLTIHMMHSMCVLTSPTSHLHLCLKPQTLRRGLECLVFCAAIKLPEFYEPFFFLSVYQNSYQCIKTIAAFVL